MNARVVIGPIKSQIETALPVEQLMGMSKRLRYHPDGYQHTWKYKQKRWDGYIDLFDIRDRTFRTGLTARVVRELTHLGYTPEVIDTRMPHETISDFSRVSLAPITPFPYQEHAAEATEGRSHGLIASPTGTGKTVIMALLLKRHAKRTLIVVNSRVLLDQTWEYFDSILPGRVGIIGSGDFDLKDVSIATIQSLCSILGIGKKQEGTSNAPALQDWLQNVGLVIHDEVHEADSDGVDGLYSRLAADTFVGTTATPYAWAHATEKGANLEMEQHFGQKVFDSRDEADFIKLGITVPLYVVRFHVPVVTTAQSAKRPYDQEGGGAEYKEVLDEQVINNTARTELIAQRARELVSHGMSCYVYYSRISYGEALCEAMGDLNPAMIQGSTPREKRNQVFKDIETKKRLLVVSDIGSYGLNIKSLDSLIIAAPTKDVRQLKGRVCRAAPGKTVGYVYDPFDDCPYLKYHSTLRLNQYRKDKDVVVG